MSHKTAIIVLGMHRSGTSIFTNILHLLGADIPKNLMKASADNPTGYFESEHFMKLNNELLSISGNTWKTYYPVPVNFLTSSENETFKQRAKTLITQEFGESKMIVLKCPRICRLMPFWESVLIESGYEVKPVIIMRDPQEVFLSLAARAYEPKFSGAAIVEPEHAALLWLRYVLDAERYSRNKKRYIISYTEITENWRFAFKLLADNLILTLHLDVPHAITQIDQLFRPEMRRQKNVEERQMIFDENFFNSYRKLYLQFIQEKNPSGEIIDILSEEMNSLFKITYDTKNAPLNTSILSDIHRINHEKLELVLEKLLIRMN
jgi:hypothetical protein